MMQLTLFHLSMPPCHAAQAPPWPTSFAPCPPLCGRCLASTLMKEDLMTSNAAVQSSADASASIAYEEDFSECHVR
jgi:hypothetical protein